MNCTTPNCNKKLMAKGMCSKCYYRVKRGGTPELSKREAMALRKCSIKDCGQPHFSNNLCARHNKRKERHGDPTFINPKCNRDGEGSSRARGYRASWKKDNAGRVNAYNSSRKRRVKNATPPWSDLAYIEQFYLNRPEGYEVDHRIPINHPNISGLHVPCNLQYLTTEENSCKNNKFDGTPDNESWRKDLKKEQTNG